MSNTVTLECSCGTVKGQLQVVQGAFFHVHCLCEDCQNFAGYLNNKDKILDEHGGSELFQTYPAYLDFSAGQEQIVGVQLHEKGLYRWHTACCHMPIANTMTSATMPFVGVSVKLMKFANEEEKLAKLGPVTLKAFAKYAIGDMPHDAHAKFPMSYMPKIIGFMLKGWVKKMYLPSPFFNGKQVKAKVKALAK